VVLHAEVNATAGEVVLDRWAELIRRTAN